MSKAAHMLAPVSFPVRNIALGNVRCDAAATQRRGEAQPDLARCEHAHASVHTEGVTGTGRSLG